MRIGAERTIEKAKELAASEFEVSPADIQYAAGLFKVAGTDLQLDLFTLAGRQPDQEIFVDSTSTVSGPTWPNGCHITEVEVDPSTGDVAVLTYASVNDVGRVVNPLIVRGQLEGGAVHEPWKLSPPPADYPAPIVDHAAERQVAIDRYNALRR